MGTEEYFPGVNWPGPEADHSPPSKAEVKNGGAISPLNNMSSCRLAKLINPGQFQYNPHPIPYFFIMYLTNIFLLVSQTASLEISRLNFCTHLSPLHAFYYYYYYYYWGGTKSSRYCGHFWPIVQAPNDR
jgi:hypothetical protein